MQVPVITLVLIVKNEAEMVAQVLADHAPLYDEALVVDTGSSDDTTTVASQAGARVITFPWCDDFAAARNRGLDQARGRWILTLDADERIDASDLGLIRQAVLDAEPCCFVLPQWNYTSRSGLPGWQPVAKRYPEQERGQHGFVVSNIIRLFPQRPDLRYEGRVHEGVDRDVTRLGLPVKYLEAPVHHYGHVRSPEVTRRRYELYGQLVRQKWRDNPDDPQVTLEMASRLLEEKRPAEAKDLLRSLERTGEVDNAVVSASLLLARILRQEGDLLAASNELGWVVTQRPRWLQGWIELLDVSVSRGRWTDVAQQLQQALNLFGPKPVLLLQKCRLLLLGGKLEAAAELSRKLAKRCPDWQVAQELAKQCTAALDDQVGTVLDTK
ncbi:MAG: glycosyltransferase [bacterium]